MHEYKIAYSQTAFTASDEIAVIHHKSLTQYQHSRLTIADSLRLQTMYARGGPSIFPFIISIISLLWVLKHSKPPSPPSLFFNA